MDKKRLIGIVTAVIMMIFSLVSVFVTHKHLNDTRDMHKLYNDSIHTLSSLVSGLGGKSVPERLTQVRLAEPQAKKAIADVRSVLDYFEALKVPNKMQSELDEVKAAIASEHEFMDKMERFFAARLPDEFSKAAYEAGEAAGLEKNHDSFDKSLERFIEHMNKCSRTKSRYDIFLWL